MSQYTDYFDQYVSFNQKMNYPIVLFWNNGRKTELYAHDTAIPGSKIEYAVYKDNTLSRIGDALKAGFKIVFSVISFNPAVAVSTANDIKNVIKKDKDVIKFNESYHNKISSKMILMDSDYKSLRDKFYGETKIDKVNGICYMITYPTGKIIWASDSKTIESPTKPQDFNGLSVKEIKFIDGQNYLAGNSIFEKEIVSTNVSTNIEDKANNTAFASANIIFIIFLLSFFFFKKDN